LSITIIIDAERLRLYFDYRPRRSHRMAGPRPLSRLVERK